MTRRSSPAAAAIVVAVAAFAFPTPIRHATASEPAVSMVAEMLLDADPEIRAIGLDGVRYGTRGAEATKRFAGLVSKLSPPRQAALLAALAERGDAAAIPAITEVLLAAKEPQVRSAAVLALGGLGGSKEVAVLERSLAAADPERSVAKRALTILAGDDTTKLIVDAATNGEPALRPLVIDVLADRRARSALPEIVRFAVDSDAAVRQAAMRALGRLGGPDEVEGMVEGLLAAPAGSEREAAERAVVAVCKQLPGKEKSAEIFLARFEAADEGDRESLLPTLGRVGGPGALAIVDRLIADATKRPFGLKALARWPDASVADRLLAILGGSEDAAERDMLLGALIRIAPLPDNTLNDQQKLELLQKTMTLCRKDEDRAKVLERANAIRTLETFRFVVPYLDDPTLAEPACRSVVELSHHQKLRDANKKEFMEALDKVIRTTKNAELVERANRYKEGKTWERKKG